MPCKPAGCLTSSGLTDQDTELLVHSIAHFPHLVAYRNLFIDAGSVRFLTQWLRWLEEFQFDNLKSSVQNEYALVARALARLLTEVVEDDARASPTPWGLPRTYKRPQETMSLNADLALRTMRLALFSRSQTLPHHLFESNGWSTSHHENLRAIQVARDGRMGEGRKTPAIPAAAGRIVQLEDEVYQANLHLPDEQPFLPSVSFDLPVVSPTRVYAHDRTRCSGADTCRWTVL
ncbi:uncharacterized protein B0H18DRAFT_1127028 [Fomitopsis serialis]|uniref:uncharacterized protein n=1 Tax=Fomitopsis serialis TaxID=139415 RepID=UPI0020073743|nr:uncharacterized protein B0H18DRAFT_1127028 [Neoantrodia serialis]KAH9912552.1 hypothetical protein B0H18DRAFT_1127028 [Neoantrodia serialis]